MDLERIRALVALAGQSTPLADAQRSEVLDALEQTECWAPFFRLLLRDINKSGKRDQAALLGDYLRFARVQNRYLEDTAAAAATASHMIKALNLRYKAVKDVVLPQVLDKEDWAGEAAILQAAVDTFSEKSDRVSCLERLCLLYEKKTHNESLLGQCYQKLLALDSHNSKALRYFKLAFTQSGEWEEVVAILRTLMSCSTHPQHVFRFAQELAGVYLYQLDDPKAAIKTLEEHCAGSPLDASTILFDAYERQNNPDGCLRVLHQCVQSVEDASARAILHYRIAQIEEVRGASAAAIAAYEKAAELMPSFLDPIENIVNISLDGQDWASVLRWLKELQQRVQDPALSEKLSEALRRLEYGLEQKS